MMIPLRSGCLVGLLLATSVDVGAETAAPAPKTAAVTTKVAAVSFREQASQPITANFQEVDFPSAMEFLSESSGVNIVLSEKAKELGKPVTVHLVEMPLSRVLEHLLKGQGLLYRYDAGTIWVATRDEMEAEPLETRVFFLKQGPGLFAAFEPLQEVRESVALQEAGVKELKTIKDTLTEVVPQVGDSKILLDERSGALIVSHVPYYLHQIEQLLQELDTTPTEVLIETRFIEVTVTDAKEWGVDGQLTRDLELKKGSERIQLSKLGPILKGSSQVNFTDFSNQTSGNGLNLTFQGILTGTQYSAVLHSLAQNTKTKTLSAPRVTTLNNQTATIKIVTEFVYPTRYEASVVKKDLDNDGKFDKAGETKFVNVPQDFVTKDLGILLRVTPSVGKDMQTITLALKPEVNEKKTDDSFGGSVSLPRFTSRNLETTVVIENGQTAVLGGLMKDTTTKTKTQVPVLGSIPVVGALFRKDDATTERSNLLIFVTAQLVNPAGAHLASAGVDAAVQ